jgi:hypothetical protein
MPSWRAAWMLHRSSQFPVLETTRYLERHDTLCIIECKTSPRKQYFVGASLFSWGWGIIALSGPIDGDLVQHTSYVQLSYRPVRHFWQYSGQRSCLRKELIACRWATIWIARRWATNMPKTHIRIYSVPQGIWYRCSSPGWSTFQTIFVQVQLNMLARHAAWQDIRSRT